MEQDAYVKSVITKYALKTLTPSATAAAQEVYRIIQPWAGQYLLEVQYSGSTAKGTAIAGIADVDLFISLAPETPGTLADIYNNLANHSGLKHLKPKRQNVSVGIRHGNHSLDLVPGRKQSGNTTDHSLYRSKSKTWTQTNVDKHVSLVKNSQRLDEIRALKIWRLLHGLDFPSFYLEMTVITALNGKRTGALAANVLTVLEYLRDKFVTAVVIDPVNSNNKLSDDLTIAEKKLIAQKVGRMPQCGELESNNMVNKKTKQIDLKQIFLGLQKEMALKLGNARLTIGHPVTKGDVTENSWRGMLEKYLPKRYAVEKAFVVDSDGNISEQIDLVIFDRHFSPFLLHQDGACYIPAESVYAVFEIKQEASKHELIYAGKKAESVRMLKRTSTHIPHAGGRYAPVVPKEVIAGFLCLQNGWKDGMSGKLKSVLMRLPEKQRLDFVCILEHGAISLTRSNKGKINTEVFCAEQALIQFFLTLLSKLQTIGSVPAIDIKAYGKSLAD